jgi:hypothetical protein
MTSTEAAERWALATQAISRAIVEFAERLQPLIKAIARIAREMMRRLRPWLRRRLHPHHAYTGHRHRGTRAWSRRYTVTR